MNHLHQFTRIEVANTDDSSLLLFNDVASRTNYGLAFPVAVKTNTEAKEDSQASASDSIRKAAAQQ